MRSARVSSAAANLPPGQKSPAKRRRNVEQQQQRRFPQSSQALLGNYSSEYQEYRSVSGILRPANEFVQFPTEYQAPQIARSNKNTEIPTGMSRPQLQQKSSATNLYEEEAFPLPPPPLNYRPPQIQQVNNGVHQSTPPLSLTNASTPNEGDLPNAIGSMHLGQPHQVYCTYQIRLLK
jgi:hypothetical protein